jgi:hypothetical protein
VASDPKALTARDIVLEYLDAHGYDGLYDDDCGCIKDDLAPCGEISTDCLPGYRTDGPPGGEYDFVVGPKLEVPNG